MFQRRIDEAAVDTENVREDKMGKRTGSMQFASGDCGSLARETPSLFSM